MTKDEITDSYLASEDEFDNPICVEIEDSCSDSIELLTSNNEVKRFAQGKKVWH